MPNPNSMTKPKHPAPPWRWMNECTLVQDRGRRDVVLVADPGGLRTKGERVLEDLHCEHPVAKLIEAAPEMYALLADMYAVRTGHFMSVAADWDEVCGKLLERLEG